MPDQQHQDDYPPNLTISGVRGDVVVITPEQQARTLILYCQLQKDHDNGIYRAYTDFIKDLTESNTLWSFENQIFIEKYQAFGKKIVEIQTTLPQEEQQALEEVWNGKLPKESKLINETPPKWALDEMEEAYDASMIKSRTARQKAVHEITDKYIKALKTNLTDDDKHIIEQSVERAVDSEESFTQRFPQEMNQALRTIRTRLPDPVVREGVAEAKRFATEVVKEDEHLAAYTEEDLRDVVVLPRSQKVIRALFTTLHDTSGKTIDLPIEARASLAKAFTEHKPVDFEVAYARMASMSHDIPPADTQKYYETAATLSTLVKQTVPPEKIVQLTEKITHAYGVFSFSDDQAKEIFSKSPERFFQALATSPTEKIWAKSADAALAILPPQMREYVKETVMHNAFVQVLQNPEKLAQTFGTEIVTSANFQALMQELAKSPPAKPEMAIGAIQNVVSTMLTKNAPSGAVPAAELYILSLSIGEKTGALPIPIEKQTDIAYKQTPLTGTQMTQPLSSLPPIPTGQMTRLSSWQHIFLHTPQEHHVMMYQMITYITHNDTYIIGHINGPTLFDWLIQNIQIGAPQKAAQTSAAGVITVGSVDAAKTAGVEAAKKGLFAPVRGFFASFSAKLGASAIGKLLGSLVASVVASPIGGVVVFIITTFPKQIFGAIKKVFRAGLGITLPFMKISKEIENYLASMGLQKYRDKVGESLIVFIIVAVVVLFSGTWFIVNPERMTGTKAPPNAGGPGGTWVDGAPVGVPANWVYRGNGIPPLASITTCPAHGSISQGPNGSFSHGGLLAYDIVNTQGAPIYSSHDAFVVQAYDDAPTNQYQNKSYGNFVILVARLTINGPYYYTIYGHMIQNSITSAVWNALASTTSSDTPTVLPAGTIIGYMDASGSTWGSCEGWCPGTHLHYEARGIGGNIMPAGCP